MRATQDEISVYPLFTYPRTAPASAKDEKVHGAARGGAEEAYAGRSESKFHSSEVVKMAAKIHVERMMHRNSIAVAGESAVSYALVKLIPTGLGEGVQADGPEPRPGSGRLRLHVRRRRHRHQPAQAHSGRRHRAPSTNSSPKTPWPSSPSPTTPSCLLPPTTISEKDKIEDVIRKIDMYRRRSGRHRDERRHAAGARRGREDRRPRASCRRSSS